VNLLQRHFSLEDVVPADGKIKDNDEDLNQTNQLALQSSSSSL